MNPPLHRPLAWRLAIAFILIFCAISASAQNKNASAAGGTAGQSASDRQADAQDSPDKKTAATQPSGGAAKTQGEQATKGADANKADPTKKEEQKTAPVTIKSVSNAAKPAQSQPASVDQVALGDRLRVVVSDRKSLIGEPADLSKIVLLLNSYPMKG